MDGVDYHFLTEREFTDRRDRGEFAEWATVHGKLYGTLKSAIRTVLESGRHVIMDIDVQGAAQVAAAWPAAVLVFMLPPSIEVLLDRLVDRKSEDGPALLTRLRSAHAELQAVNSYHYVLVNDRLDAAVARVSAIIDAEEVNRERVRALDKQLSGLITRLDAEIGERTAGRTTA